MSAVLTAVQAPVLEAYRDDDGRLHVWCPHELTWHRHGDGCRCTWGICTCPIQAFVDGPGCTCGRLQEYGICYCPVGTGDGHRGSHCRCQASPYRESGYELREVGELTPEVLAAHTEVSYERGCTWDSCRLYRKRLLEMAKQPQQLPPPDAPADVAEILRRGFVDVHSQAHEDLAYRPAQKVSLSAESWPTSDVFPDAAPIEYVTPESVPMLALDGAPLVLRRWRGSWMRWLGPRWVELEQEDFIADLSARLKGAQWVKRLQKGPVVMPWQPNRNNLGEVAAALGSITLLGSDVEAPSWLDGRKASGPVVACSNGLLETDTRQLVGHSPDWFNLVSVPFDYHADAGAPRQWLDFLHRLWPDDDDSIAALQEWFGYVLSGRTNLQKMLLLVGPPRAGKGTIARILTELIGRGHVASPTLAALSANFGLEPLIGKPLGIVADARLAGRDTHQVVERLLSISGEDSHQIDRKYRQAWTGRLPTRLMIMSNELPNFGDASGAIATRFIALSLEKSWLGSEDTSLERRLLTELPGVLLWALEGLDRLQSQGRFTEPPGSAETLITMTDAASPMSAFVRERCIVGPGEEVTVARLWAAWQGWCLENGREHQGTQQTLGRNLKSVLPASRLVRPRDASGRQVRTYQGLSLRPVETRPLQLSAKANGPDVLVAPQLPRHTHE